MWITIQKRLIEYRKVGMR